MTETGVLRTSSNEACGRSILGSILVNLRSILVNSRSIMVINSVKPVINSVKQCKRTSHKLSKTQSNGRVNQPHG